MCKRYYVEVTGLDSETGEEQLQSAGIDRGSILVVDESNPVERAIRTVLGIGMADIRKKASGRSVVAARTMYVHFAILGGDSVGKVASDTGRTRYRIQYYEADYERKMFGDREFRVSAERVQELLNIDPAWQPATSIQPFTAKKKTKKKKKRKKTTELRKVTSNNNKRGKADYSLQYLIKF